MPLRAASTFFQSDPPTPLHFFCGAGLFGWTLVGSEMNLGVGAAPNRALELASKLLKLPRCRCLISEVQSACIPTDLRW
jgi:hypothetical protein